MRTNFIESSSKGFSKLESQVANNGGMKSKGTLTNAANKFKLNKNSRVSQSMIADPKLREEHKSGSYNNLLAAVANGLGNNESSVSNQNSMNESFYADWDLSAAQGSMYD